MTLLWLLLGTLTHPTFAITAVGMTLAAHLVTDTGARRRGAGPRPMAWRFTWMPAVVLLLAFYTGLWLFFTTERLVGEAAGSPELLLPVARLQPVARARDGERARRALPAAGRDAGTRRFGLMTACWARCIASSRCSSVGTCISCRCRCCTCRRRFRWCSARPARCAWSSSRRRSVSGDAAVALVLVLAAALSPSTVSHLCDGSRFDYRPALARIRTDRPRRHGGAMAPGAGDMGRAGPRGHRAPPHNAAVAIRFAAGGPTTASGSSPHSGGRRLSPTRTGASSSGSARHCDRVLTTGRPRYDFEQYVTDLWECRRADRRRSGTQRSHRAAARQRLIAPSAMSLTAPAGQASFRTLGRETAIYGLGVILGRAVSFLMLPVYTRFLTPGGLRPHPAARPDGGGGRDLLHGGRHVRGAALLLQDQRPSSASASSSPRPSSWCSPWPLGALTLAAFSPWMWHFGLKEAGKPWFIRLAAVNFALGSLLNYAAQLRADDAARRACSWGPRCKLVLQLSLNISSSWCSARRGGPAVEHLHHQPGAGRGRWRLAAAPDGHPLRPASLRDLRRFGVPYQVSWAGVFLLTFGDRFFLQAGCGRDRRRVSTAWRTSSASCLCSWGHTIPQRLEPAPAPAGARCPSRARPAL